MDEVFGNVPCFSYEDKFIRMSENPGDYMLKHNENQVTVDCLISKSKDQDCSVFEVESNKIAQAMNDACRTQLASEAIQMAIGGPIAEFEQVLHCSSPIICQSPSLLSCQTCLRDQFVDSLLCRHETPNISLGCLWKWIQELVRGDKSIQHKMYGDPSSLVALNLHDLHSRSWSYIHTLVFVLKLWKSTSATLVSDLPFRYSVAWYPIYRIPDGNFQAAFLTYHSLGHFVHRGTNFGSPSEDASVVSPVLGLQSYNAQVECWFQLQHSAVSQTTKNQSRILKELLRTLEAASLIATAVVNKGSETSVK
ncbi:hypothetical protein JCGZ_17426 [Jatropha curcas]|uniref:Uncharacterized protein n=1 Tax=Jatropha curcas TaxID=180498 RepID=A0A067LN10_JATCU|nr:hypothetical protein JCGZ_17426 [Jatropha curcas]